MALENPAIDLQFLPHDGKVLRELDQKVELVQEKLDALSIDAACENVTGGFELQLKSPDALLRLVTYLRNLPPMHFRDRVRVDVRIQNFPLNYSAETVFELIEAVEKLFCRYFDIKILFGSCRQVEWNCYIYLNSREGVFVVP